MRDRYKEEEGGVKYEPGTNSINTVSQPGGDPAFLRIIEDIKQMHINKSADYGTDEDIYANVRASEDWGIPAWEGAMIRACDKIARLQTYAKKGVLANEGVRDSFLDLASYAIIAAALFEQDVEAKGEDKIGRKEYY